MIGYKKSSVFSGLLISILFYSFGISLIALEKFMAVILIVSSKKLGKRNTLIFKKKGGQIFDKKISKKILRTYLFSKNREKQSIYSEINIFKLHLDRFEKFLKVLLYRILLEKSRKNKPILKSIKKFHN